MLEQVKSSDEEQPLVGAELSPPLVARFRVLPLYCLVFFFLTQLMVTSGYYWLDGSRPFLVASQCFGLATVWLAFAFNHMQVCSHEENDGTKNVWALKYLWEIKSNAWIHVGLFFIQVYMDMERQRTRIALTCFSANVGDLTVRLFSSLTIIVLSLTVLLLLYVAFVAHRFALKIKSEQQQQQQQLCVTHLAFTGFQVVFKISTFATLSLLYFERGDQNAFQSFGVMLVLGGILFYFCQASVRYLLWTPSPIIFDSTELQSQIIDESLRLYIGMGIVVFLRQIQMSFSASYDISYGYHGFHWNWKHYSAFLGLLLLRILHVMLCVLMNAMAIKVNKPQVGIRYLLVDIVLSMLCIFMLICLTWYSFRSLHVEMSILVTGVMLFISSKVGLFVNSTVRRLQKSDLAAVEDIDSWQSDFKYLIGWLSALFVGAWVYDYLYEQSRDESTVEFGMTLCWLISLVGVGCYYMSTKQQSLQQEYKNGKDQVAGV